MKKLPFLVAMAVLFALSGCSEKTPTLPIDTHDETKEVIHEFSKVEKSEEPSSQLSNTGTDQENKHTEGVSVQEKKEESTEQITYPTEEIKESVPKTNIIQSEFPKEEVAIPETSVPHSTEASTEPQSTIDSEKGSPTESMNETEPIPEESKPQQEEIKDFDISAYVEYAKNYAVEKGLKLDSTAVSCWDDPISANADSKYLERDIRDRLDWYCVSGYSSVWAWSVDEGNGQYSIYIGYA